MMFPVLKTIITTEMDVRSGSLFIGFETDSASGFMEIKKAAEIVTESLQISGWILRRPPRPCASPDIRPARFLNPNYPLR